MPNELSRAELKKNLWEIIRSEGILVTNQNLDWLLERSYKKARNCDAE